LIYSENSKYIVECENLVKIYKTKDIEVVALQGLDLAIESGEFMAIIGNSGSGKSTLLNMLGGLDKPSAGKLVVDGKNLSKLSEKQLNEYKLYSVGFIWQNNARNLIPYLTALQNVELPIMLAGKSGSRGRAKELLEMVGLSKRMESKLSQLSGGEQQRVAIAIALMNSPKLLLADEPTGSVDTKTANEVMDVLRDFNKNLGITVTIVTHDRQLSKKVDRVVAIRDGRTSSEFIRKKSYAEELAEMKEGIVNEETEQTHVEMVVVDKAGRLQIPREYLDALGLKEDNKLIVELDGSRIVLFTPDKLRNKAAV